MDCFDCRHVDTGGDRVVCYRGGKFVLSKEQANKGCKNIDCSSEEERHPIQIAPSDRGVRGMLFALCDDHSIWSYAVGPQMWSRVEGIPQRGRGGSDD